MQLGINRRLRSPTGQLVPCLHPLVEQHQSPVAWLPFCDGVAVCRGARPLCTSFLSTPHHRTTRIADDRSRSVSSEMKARLRCTGSSTSTRTRQRSARSSPIVYRMRAATSERGGILSNGRHGPLMAALKRRHDGGPQQIICSAPSCSHANPSATLDKRHKMFVSGKYLERGRRAPVSIDRRLS